MLTAILSRTAAGRATGSSATGTSTLAIAAPTSGALASTELCDELAVRRDAELGVQARDLMSHGPRRSAAAPCDLSDAPSTHELCDDRAFGTGQLDENTRSAGFR